MELELVHNRTQQTFRDDELMIAAASRSPPHTLWSKMVNHGKSQKSVGACVCRQENYIYML